MAEKIISVRTALLPAYYKDFRCLAAACQDSCCIGWTIEFNKKDYLAIKRAARSEALKTKLAQAMPRLREREHDGMYAEFKMNEKNQCGLLREDGLCALQLECGAETLPEVCSQFPRHSLYTLAAREYSLSPGCEAVLALLWDLPQGIDFIEEPLEKKDWKCYQQDKPIAARFTDIRSFCVDVLQERSLTLRQRMLLLGILLQKLRDGDWAQEETVDTWLEQGVAMLHSPSMAVELDKLSGNRRMFLTNCHHVMMTSMVGDLSTATLFQELWVSILIGYQEEGSSHFTFDIERYEELEAQLTELLDHSEYFFENLIVTVAFHLRIPALLSPEALWKSYVNLCNIYSLYRFSAVCGCAKEVSRERLFHVMVGISRSLLHNKTRRNQLQDSFFQHDSATLAHMAILLGG